MRILICNDDGIAAPGLRVLSEAARSLSGEVWTVAPERKWTAASHQLSFDRDLTLTHAGERRYACSGAPADCVVAAMTILFADGPKPDLLLAGINDKRNVAEDLAYSGTMAIAREATFCGVPAIALSQVDGVGDEAALRATLSRLLPALWASRRGWVADGHWLSVNLPARLPAALVQAHIGRDKLAVGCDVSEAADERITYRIRRARAGTRSPGDENSAIDAGCITVVRHRWHADAMLPDAMVAAWSDAVASAGIG